MGTTPRPRWEKRRKRWYFTVGGKKFTAKSHADIAAKYAAVTGGEPPNEIETPKTVFDAIQAWLVGRDSEFHVYCTDQFEAFAGLRPVADLDSRTLERFLVSLRKRKLSLQTQLHVMRHAYRVLEWCQQHGWLEALPVKPKIAKPVWKPKSLTSAELTKLLADLDTPRRKRLRRLVLFILATGSRPSETRLLKWTDVDAANATGNTARPKAST